MEHRWNPDEYVADWRHALGVIEMFFPFFHKYIPLTPPPKEVLELGVGSGKWSAAFTIIGSHVTGVDNVEGMLERVIDNFPSLHRCIRLVLDDATTLELLTAKYDIIFSEGLYEHFLDDEVRAGALYAWYNKLNNGGSCIIMVPRNNIADDEICFKNPEELSEDINSVLEFDNWICVDLHVGDKISFVCYIGKKLL